MIRDTQTAALPLPSAPGEPTERDAWALAIQHCPSFRGYTFERAMETQPIAIAIRCTAEAMRRRWRDSHTQEAHA